MTYLFHVKHKNTKNPPFPLPPPGGVPFIFPPKSFRSPCFVPTPKNRKTAMDRLAARHLEPLQGFGDSSPETCRLTHRPGKVRKRGQPAGWREPNRPKPIPKGAAFHLKPAPISGRNTFSWTSDPSSGRRPVPQGTERIASL